MGIDQKFEDSLKKRFDNLEQAPAFKGWNDIEQELDKQEGNKQGGIVVFSLIAVIILGILSVFTFTKKSDKIIVDKNKSNKNSELVVVESPLYLDNQSQDSDAHLEDDVLKSEGRRNYADNNSNKRAIFSKKSKETGKKTNKKVNNASVLSGTNSLITGSSQIKIDANNRINNTTDNIINGSNNQRESLNDHEIDLNAQKVITSRIASNKMNNSSSEVNLTSSRGKNNEIDNNDLDIEDLGSVSNVMNGVGNKITKENDLTDPLSITSSQKDKNQLLAIPTKDSIIQDSNAIVALNENMNTEEGKSNSEDDEDDKKKKKRFYYQYGLGISRTSLEVSPDRADNTFVSVEKGFGGLRRLSTELTFKGGLDFKKIKLNALLGLQNMSGKVTYIEELSEVESYDIIDENGNYIISPRFKRSENELSFNLLKLNAGLGVDVPLYKKFALRMNYQFSQPFNIGSSSDLNLQNSGGFELGINYESDKIIAGKQLILGPYYKVYNRGIISTDFISEVKPSMLGFQLSLRNRRK